MIGLSNKQETESDKPTSSLQSWAGDLVNKAAVSAGHTIATVMGGLEELGLKYQNDRTDNGRTHFQEVVHVATELFDQGLQKFSEGLAFGKEKLSQLKQAVEYPVNLAVRTIREDQQNHRLERVEELKTEKLQGLESLLMVDTDTPQAATRAMLLRDIEGRLDEVLKTCTDLIHTQDFSKKGFNPAAEEASVEKVGQILEEASERFGLIQKVENAHGEIDDLVERISDRSDKMLLESTKFSESDGQLTNVGRDWSNGFRESFARAQIEEAVKKTVIPTETAEQLTAAGVDPDSFSAKAYYFIDREAVEVGEAILESRQSVVVQELKAIDIPQRIQEERSLVAQLEPLLGEKGTSIALDRLSSIEEVHDISLRAGKYLFNR